MSPEERLVRRITHRYCANPFLQELAVHHYLKSQGIDYYKEVADAIAQIIKAAHWAGVESTQK